MTFGDVEVVCRGCGSMIAWHKQSDLWRLALLPMSGNGSLLPGSAQCASGHHVPDLPTTMDRESVEAWLAEPGPLPDLPF